MSKHWESFKLTFNNLMAIIEKFIKYIIFYSLILSLFLSIISTTGDLSDILEKNIFAFIIPIIIIIIIISVISYLIRSKLLIKVKENKFLIITLSIAFIISIFSVVLIDSEAIRDLLRYHIKAIKIINGEISISYIWVILEIHI